MKKLRFLILLAIFILSFSMGNMVGLSLGKESDSQNHLSQDETVMQQTSVLLINVDRLDIPAPTLEAVWLLLVLPPQSKISLIPIYPVSSKSPHDQFIQPGTVISSTDLNTGDNSLVKALRDHKIMWDQYIILDQTGFFELAKQIDGDNIGSGWINNEIVNLSFSISEDNPDTALPRQAFIYQQLCLNLSSISILSKLNILFDSDHVITDITPDQLLAVWNIYRDSSVFLNCKFPTMDQ